ncbi:MAG: AEC family transporter [Gammaproteobacteria bacterium]|nr:AEC family transporter [Gammaproteobacteria bacterium]
MEIASILFPVLFIVLLGYFYARKFKPDMDVANGLVLRVFIPALAFDVLSKGDFQVVAYSWLMLGGVIVVLGSGLIAWPVGKLFRIPKQVFVPTMMFNNCGNLGLPLAVLAFGDHALGAAVVLFLISNIGHFTVGVYLFGGAVSWKSLAVTPVNLVTLLALVFNFSGIRVPEMIQFPISLLAQVGIPLMLFSLGVRMLSIRFDHWKVGLIGGLVCPVSGLIGAYVASLVLPLDPMELGVLFLFAALPPAVLNFLFAERYRQHPELVASVVLLSHAMAIVVLSVVLWWLV